jgi:hypothetical protein
MLLVWEKYSVDSATFDPIQLTALFESLVSHIDEIKGALAAGFLQIRAKADVAIISDS